MADLRNLGERNGESLSVLSFGERVSFPTFSERLSFPGVLTTGLPSSDWKGWRVQGSGVNIQVRCRVNSAKIRQPGLGLSHFSGNSLSTL